MPETQTAGWATSGPAVPTWAPGTAPGRDGRGCGRGQRAVRLDGEQLHEQPEAGPAALRLFYKFRFQLHRANAIDFAVDIVVAADDADVFHLGSDFDYR